MRFNMTWRTRLLACVAMTCWAFTLVNAGWAAMALPVCEPGETLDKGRCVTAEPDEPRRETRTVTTTTTTVPPVRTIREGQSTTVTVPVPAYRQLIRCAKGGDQRVDVPTTNAVADCTSDADDGAGTIWGPCNGPWSVVVLTGDSRVVETSGRRVRVVTDATDALNDTGIVEVVYALRGTMSVTWQGPWGTLPVTTQQECDMVGRLTVQVNPVGHSGLNARAAQYAPSRAWINGTTTVTTTCEQFKAADPDHVCDAGTSTTTTTDNEFPAPRGCKILVTVAKNGKGYGSTGCLTANQMAVVSAEIEAAHDGESIDVGSLPTCPDPKDFATIQPSADGRKRCVAKN